MIIACNSEITKILYSGYTINKVIGCGNVVYDNTTPPTPTSFKVRVIQSSDTYEKPCDSSSTIDWMEIINLIPTSSKSAITSTEIGSCVTRIGENSFNQCVNLTSVTFNNANEEIGHDAFKNCGLKAVQMPQNLRLIESNAFETNEDLSAVTFNNGLTTIGVNAFYSNISLLDIVIPSSVTSIGDDAFRTPHYAQGDKAAKVAHLASARTVTFLATTPPTLGGNVFDVIGGGGTDIATYPIYVPASAVNAYKTAWATLSNRIFAIT